MNVENIFSNYTFIMVFIGTTLLGLLCGGLGAFLVIRRESLMGDGLAHSALPGIVVAFWLIGSKHSMILIIGALISVVIAVALLFLLVKIIKLPFDGSLAAVLSTFFGLGIMCLSMIQKAGNSNQSGIKQFVFGQAATMMANDVYLIIGLTVAVACIVSVCWKELFVLVFDEQYGNSIGISMNRWKIILYFMVTLVVLLSLQVVGVILTSAMLIAPCLTARQWCDTWKGTVISSSCIGGLAAFCGTYVSILFTSVPTGPSIAVFSCTLGLLSILIAPKRGVLYKWAMALYRSRHYE